MNNNKLKTIAFTGHRMNRIRIEKDEFSSLIAAAIIHFYIKGYRVFLNGCAQGFDMIAAEEVLKVKEHYPDIELHCIIPFAGQSDRMSLEDQLQYNAILSAADYKICLSETYFDGCFLRRNDYLIENSTQIITYYDKATKGGTYYTVKNAIEKEIDVFNLFDEKMEYHHFYQDELLTGWGRASFKVKAISWEQAVESIRLLNFQDITELEGHPSISFEHYEYVTETFTPISLKENEGQATMEYLIDDSLKTLIFSNENPQIVEDNKIIIANLANLLAEKQLLDTFNILPSALRDKCKPDKYDEKYRKKYDEYFKNYFEQLSTL